MTVTTIKVDRAVRDRLASIARDQGVTMGALLDAVSRKLETAQRWAAIEEAYERLRREDPASWHGYLTELDQITAGEPDATAAEEWLEYNL